MPPTGPKPKFREGEQVLCSWGSQIYEAKVLEVRPKLVYVWYALHFPGWSKKWDTWVKEDRLMEWNPDHLKKQRELPQAQGAHPEKVEPTKRKNTSGHDSQSSQKKRKGVEKAVPSPASLSNTSYQLSPGSFPSTSTSKPTPPHKPASVRLRGRVQRAVASPPSGPSTSKGEPRLSPKAASGAKAASTLRAKAMRKRLLSFTKTSKLGKGASSSSSISSSSSSSVLRSSMGKGEASSQASSSSSPSRNTRLSPKAASGAKAASTLRAKAMRKRLLSFTKTSKLGKGASSSISSSSSSSSSSVLRSSMGKGEASSQASSSSSPSRNTAASSDSTTR